MLSPLKTVAFSGCGWLFPFHIGVVEALVQRSLVNESTVWAGTSAGSLVAAAMASGVSPRDMMDVALGVRRRLQAKRKMNRGPLESLSRIRVVWGKAGTAVEGALISVLPQDVVSRCKGRFAVAVTPLRHKSDPWLHRREPTLITEFEDRDDLIGACLCSSHIPFYVDGTYSREWRGKFYVDGGFADIFPERYTRKRRQRAVATAHKLESEHELVAKASIAKAEGSLSKVNTFSGVVMSCPYRDIASRMKRGFLIGPSSPLHHAGTFMRSELRAECVGL